MVKTTSNELFEVLDSYSYLYEEGSSKFLVFPFQSTKIVTLNKNLPLENGSECQFTVQLEINPNTDGLFSDTYNTFGLMCSITPSITVRSSGDTDFTVIPSSLCKLVSTIFKEDSPSNYMEEEDVSNFAKLANGDIEIESIDDIDSLFSKENSSKEAMLLDIVYGNSDTGKLLTVLGLFTAHLIENRLDDFSISVDIKGGN